MIPSLAKLPATGRATFRLRTSQGVHTLPELLAEAASLAPTLPVATGGVLEIPAREPRSTIVHLEAAFVRGFLPLPNGQCEAPRVLPVQRDIAAAQLLMRTSGSTGAPRLPAFAFAGLVRSARRIAEYLELTAEDELALLQPLDHGFGLVGQLFTAIAGGAAVNDCATPFPGERAAAVAACRATVLAAVPHTLQLLAEHLPELDLEACRRLRSVGSAGGRLSPALARRLALAFPNAVIWNQYGCTEAGPRLTAVPSTHIAFYTGTVGRALDGVHLWIRDPARPSGQGDVLGPGAPGEICFTSDAQMLGYLGDPAATERQRRQLGPTSGFWTGDLGLLDPDDRLHVLGRGDDLVKVRGERVSLYSLARAAESAGARAAIAILTEPRAESADGVLTLAYESDRELSAVALARALPATHGRMVPRRMLWLAALPRLPSGKIDRTSVELLAKARETHIETGSPLQDEPEADG